MIFTRIEPFQQETFYVLSDDGADISRIANSPICFSPVSYRQQIVDAGDIPTNAKIVLVDQRHTRIKLVNLEAAIKLSNGEQFEAAGEISAAIDMLKAAMQRHGLEAPIRIELQNSSQAIKLALLFGDKLSTGALARAITSILTLREGFMILGILFTWKKSPASRGTSLIKRITDRVH